MTSYVQQYLQIAREVDQNIWKIGYGLKKISCDATAVMFKQKMANYTIVGRQSLHLFTPHSKWAGAKHKSL